MGFVRVFLSMFVQASSTLLLIYCVMSWFVPYDSKIRIWIASIVDPMLDPIRRVMPDFGRVDFSPIVLMILLQVLQRLINNM